MKSKKVNITNRERDVMDVLWDRSTPLLASDITKINPSLSVSSVQSSLRNLLSKGFIEVADIIHSGTVLSRSYRPLVSREEFLITSFKNYDKDISTRNIVATLLKHEKNEGDTIKELEEFLEERKKQLNQSIIKEEEE